MPYVWSLVTVAVALVVLALLVVAALGPLRRTTTVAGEMARQVGHDTGMLAARTAALRVRWDQRRRLSEPYPAPAADLPAAPTVEVPVASPAGPRA